MKSKRNSYILQGLACFFLALYPSPTPLKAQYLKEAKKSAEKAMKQGNFTLANAYWDYIDAHKSLKGKDALAKAYCELENAFYNKSWTRLKSLSKKNKKSSTALYLFARLHHLKEEYKEANFYYRQFLHHSDEKDTLRPKAKLYLAQLFNAQQEDKGATLMSFITENDSTINTPYDDYGLYRHPITSDKYFFTSNKIQALNKKRACVFALDKQIFSITGEEGFWKGKAALNAKYNAPLAENTVLGFLDNGYQIVYKRGEDIFVDNYPEDSLSVNLALPLFKEKYTLWSGDFYFFANKVLLLSAESVDGFGGKDIYWSYYQEEEGVWSEPVNLGAQINSPFDERSPFLANDGQTLYFSRNSRECIGGYDIFVAHFNANTLAWSVPEALPKPINSVADDLFFYPQTDGMTAYLSSNRGQSKGGLDFFTVLLAEYMPEQATRKELRSFVDILLTPPIYTTENTLEKIGQEGENLPSIVAEKPIAHYLHPMFYEQNINSAPSAAKNLQTLSTLMTQHQDLQLLLNIHAHSLNQSQAYTLFLSLKQAENFAQQLINASVEPHRILLRSGGNLYPIASPYYYDGSPNPNAQKLNQRATLNLFNDAELPFQIKNQIITIGPLMKMQEESPFEKNQTGLHYKILLRKSNTLWRHAILEERKDLVLEQWGHEPTIFYLCGFFHSYAQASETLENIKKSYDLESLLILPYIDNWRLDEENLYLQLETYPDLKNYLDASK